MRVRFSARTHPGMRREVNQDAYGSSQPGSATLLVVCDGMGGHAAGEVASSLGVETIIGTFRADSPPEVALREAFVAANQRIYTEGHGSMGTTGVAALFLQNVLHVANVGDSRAYLVREDQIIQISQDHSFVNDQVAAGLMTPEQARSSNIRNIITRALGHTSEIDVDLFTAGLRPGDTVILSSDGMHGLLADEEIAEFAGVLTLEEAAQRLVDIANERGGPDNITVVIARVDELDSGGNGDTAITAALQTVPFNTTAVVDQTQSPAVVDEPSVPVQTLASTEPSPVAASTRRLEAQPAEKPLSRLGLLLAALTLVVLLGLGGLLLTTGVPAPAGAPTLPQPASSATLAAASPAPTTGSPTSATTATPAASSTARTAATPARTPTP